MMRSWMAACAALLLPVAVSAAEPPVPEPIEVMVLGTYHFGNPGRDQHNIVADDVLAPRRQAELTAVAAALARFRPTRVMVEVQVDAADLADPGYARFTPAALATERNEIVQIGYRLAYAAGLDRVEGIDEQPGPGEPDYFPYDAVQAYAATHGQAAVLDHAGAAVGSAVQAFDARQASAGIAELLTVMNDPAEPLAGNAFYYEALAVGDRTDQPGATLNAMWYLRNAKIFAKLMTVARPGDRIVIVYGAGHGFWLRHFARETPGFEAVDSRPYLAAAR